MKKIISIVLIISLFTVEGLTQTKQIKNVILMIPDGTSWATVSSARWYKWYLDRANGKLNLDPYFCGSVLTFSSNAPIGDSAPTTSCFMTGVPSRAGYVATYPPVDPQNDIIPLDSTKAYQPMLTALEAAKMNKKMAAGLVFTCEFPHATPADCSAHSYNRAKYEWIAPQMVHNNLDVVIGGGVKHLSDDMQNYLAAEGVGVFKNDINGFRSYTGNKMWSLFCENDMPYDLDRDAAQYPSLAEMTAKAIEKLSKNENGFFLMVEGSKVDWAAHANDPVAMITDMIAFDDAFGVALDFAKSNGETVIIALPDHGNSGISIGAGRCPDYSHLTADQLFKTVTSFKATSDVVVTKLKNTEPDKMQETFKQLTGIELNNDDLKKILASGDYTKSSLSNDERMKGTRLKRTVTEIFNRHNCFGFTTGGHTGEEVFLAVYAPDSALRISGTVRNTEINKYICDLLGLGNLEQQTAQVFAKHTDVFRNFKYDIKRDGDNVSLEVVKNKKNKLTVYPFTNIVELNGKPVKIGSVTVYVDKTDTFYLPETLSQIFDN